MSWRIATVNFMIFLALFVFLPGIGSGQQVSHEKLLIDSGHKMIPADSAKWQKTIKGLPAGTIIIHKKDGKTASVYKDSSENLYLGDHQAYQTYQNKAKEQQIQPLPSQDAEPSDPEFWTMWADEHGA